MGLARGLSLFAVAFLSAACDGERNPAAPPPPTADFTVACSPAGFAAPRGCATSACSVTSTNGFAGSVSLSCSGAPTGLACSFGPNPLSLSANQHGVAGFTVSADPSVASRVHTFDVVASGAGLRRSTTVQVEAVAPPPPATSSQFMTVFGCAGYTSGTLNRNSPQQFVDSIFVGAWRGGWNAGAGGTFCAQTQAEDDGSFVLEIRRGCIPSGDRVYLSAGGLRTCVEPAFETGTAAHVTLFGSWDESCL